MALVFRWLVRVAGGLLVLAALGVFMVWYLASQSLPDYDRRLQVRGLAAPVEIVNTRIPRERAWLAQPAGSGLPAVVLTPSVMRNAVLFVAPDSASNVKNVCLRAVPIAVPPPAERPATADSNPPIVPFVISWNGSSSVAVSAKETMPARTPLLLAN